MTEDSAIRRRAAIGVDLTRLEESAMWSSQGQFEQVIQTVDDAT